MTLRCLVLLTPFACASSAALTPATAYRAPTPWTARFEICASPEGRVTSVDVLDRGGASDDDLRVWAERLRALQVKARIEDGKPVAFCTPLTITSRSAEARDDIGDPLSG